LVHTHYVQRNSSKATLEDEIGKEVIVEPLVVTYGGLMSPPGLYLYELLDINSTFFVSGFQGRDRKYVRGIKHVRSHRNVVDELISLRRESSTSTS
jgi:hypothetical protein